MNDDNQTANPTSALSHAGPLGGLPWRRIAVTLGALAIFWLGLKIPAPGVSVAGVASPFEGPPMRDALERLSIFALGLSPLLSVLIPLEVLKLAAPDWMASFRHKRAPDTELGYVAIGVTLLIAAFQGYGIAVALESLNSTTPLVPEPGWAFRATYVATTVAATAFLIWLADQITRHGIGSGVWVLLSVATFSSLVQVSVTSPELIATGAITSFQAIACVAWFVFAVAALVAISRAVQAAAPQAPNHTLAKSLLWPPLIATTAHGYVSGLATILQNVADTPSSGPFPFQYGTVSGLALLVALNFFLTRAMSVAPRTLALAAATATSGLLLLTEFWSRIGLPDWLDFWLIPIVLVLLVALPVRLADRFND